MELYEIELSNKAEKNLKKLQKDIQKKVIKKIDGLATNPHPSGSKKLSTNEENIYRIREGDYRILYTIKNQKLLILILVIGHRREIYRDL